jgi:hypothetical protein
MKKISEMSKDASRLAARNAEHIAVEEEEDEGGHYRIIASERRMPD